MAAACCRRCCFFKFLCFVTLFVQCLDTHNSICSPPSNFKGLLASVESYFLLLAAVKTLLLQDAQLSYRSPNGQSMVRRLLLCLKEVLSRTYLLQRMLKLTRVRKILTKCRVLYFKIQDQDFLSVDVIYFNFAPVVLRLNWIIILFIA